MFNKITWLSFLAIPCLLLASRISLSMRVLRSTNRYFLLLLAFATLSVIWSVDRVASISRITHALAVILVCFAVAVVGWNATRLQQVTRPVLTILLLGSLIFGLVAPDLAITPPVPPDTNSYWHGLTSQKNQLGSIASIGAILWLHGWASREVKLLPAFAGWVISMACIVLSRSATSLMATVLASILLLMLLRTAPSMRRYMPYIVGIFVTFTLAYSLAVLKVIPALDFLIKPIMVLSGKDPSFSGRTQIWDVIRAHIQLSPLIGSGYGGYWGGPVPTSPSYVFLGIMYFYPSEAHNGYLDTINDLGYVGLVLLLGYIIAFIRQSLRLFRINHSQAGLYLALIFQQLLANLSETHWLYIANDFIVLTLATFGLSRSLLEAMPVAQRSGL